MVVMVMAIIGYYLRRIVERDLFVLPRGGGGCSFFNTLQVLLTKPTTVSGSTTTCLRSPVKTPRPSNLTWTPTVPLSLCRRFRPVSPQRFLFSQHKGGEAAVGNAAALWKQAQQSGGGNRAIDVVEYFPLLLPSKSGWN